MLFLQNVKRYVLLTRKKRTSLTNRRASYVQETERETPQKQHQFETSRLQSHHYRVKSTQGHPMDLYLKISVLQANFCWLGDLEGELLLGNRQLRVYLLFVRNLSPSTKGDEFWSMTTPKLASNAHTSTGKLPIKSGCRLQLHLAGSELFHQSCWE